MTCTGSSVPRVKERKCKTPPLRVMSQQTKMKHNDTTNGNYQESLEQVGDRLKFASPELESGQAVDPVVG